MKIIVVDYGMGNLRSVVKAILQFTDTVKISARTKDILTCDKLVLPGVGAFGQAVNNLNKLNLILPIKEYLARKKPFLGICLGLQLLFTQSSEGGGTYPGLNVVKGTVERFKFHPSKKHLYKIPQIGWNQVNFKNRTPYFTGIPDKSYFYFVHSYYVIPENQSVIASTTNYGIRFVSAINTENILATQFHPEKSGILGLKIIKNFVKL